MSSATVSHAPFVIRPATAGDLPAIISLLSASSLPTAGVARSLGGFQVAEAAGEIVGVVGVESCDGRHALLRSTAVSPAWRGRRVGRALVEHAVRAAESNGVDALYLLTTTAESYFPSFGFTPVSRVDVPAAVAATEEFRSACPASATVMARAKPALHAPAPVPMCQPDAA